MLIGIPSNRSKRLRACLLNVFEALKEEGTNAEVVVVDGSGEAEKNRQFAEEASSKYGAKMGITDEYAFRDAQKPAFRQLFSGPYGGPRNVILAKAVERKRNVVFLDDDVVPTQEFFRRFEDLLAEHDIVVGAYAGKRTGSSFLMDKASRALTDFIEGRITKEEALQKAREAFSGVSDDWPPSVEGYRGGCLGVSWKAAQKYCFFPTSYRMEDGLFCSLATFFTGSEAFKPFLPYAPVGYHKPEKGEMGTLVEYYLNSVRGAAIGLSIEYAVKKFGSSPTKEQVSEACEKGPADLLREFSPERFELRRKRQEPLDRAVKALGDKELEQQYYRFANFSLDDARPNDLETQASRFFECQKSWKEFMAETPAGQ